MLEGSRVGLVVPVYLNFRGFAELMASVDIPVTPYIVDNWNVNRGVGPGWNEGLKRAASDGMDFAFVVNDDAVFRKGSMLRIIEGLDEYDLCSGVNIIDGEIDESNTPVWIEGADYSCFAVKPRDFIDRFGLFDEAFAPAYFEDNDMHYRMSLLGGTEMRCTRAPFYEERSTTQNWGGQRVVNSQMFDANRSYYIRKWGGLPEQETFLSPFNGEVSL